ncbi:MAG: ATP-binding protein [Natronosporangium sp.]
MDDLIPRAASEQLDELIKAFRIVIVNGPRQAGKTTLLRLYEHSHGGEYRSLDSAPTLATAEADPESFVRIGERPLIIDEVQYGGDRLLRAVKQVVDSVRGPGQFLLSGSTRFLTVPTLSESLAGRAVFVDLWPLSMAERTDHASSDFLDRVFTDLPSLRGFTSPWQRDDYLCLLCQGSYPEVVSIDTPRQRRSWFNGYVRMVTSRDVRQFAHLPDIRMLGQLLGMVAARSGGLLVFEDLARGLGSTAHTVRTHLSYLETVFLCATVPAWSTNLTSRITKTPKVFLTDVGLAANLLRVSSEALRRPGHPALGGLLETFVYTELLKAQARTGDAFSISHLRDRDGREVDFLCEGPDGLVTAFEVKASLSPRSDADRHLRWLRDKIGDRFAAGVVFYLGEHSYSLGDRILLLPVSALWNHTQLP